MTKNSDKTEDQKPTRKAATKSNSRKTKIENKKTSRAAIRRPSSRPKNISIRKSGPQSAETVSPPIQQPRKPKVAVVDPKPKTSISQPPKTTTIKPIATGPGRIRITSLPAAEIFINSQMFGTTNDRNVVRKGLVLDPGDYTLTLKRRGYESMSEKVSLSSDQTVNLNFILQRAQKQVSLSLQSNKLPTKVEIEDLSSEGNKRIINLIKKSTKIDLDPGSYRIIANHGSEKIERVIELRSDSITFNARFK